MYLFVFNSIYGYKHVNATYTMEKICQKHFLDIPTEDEHLVVIDSEECYTCKLEQKIARDWT